MATATEVINNWCPNKDCEFYPYLREDSIKNKIFYRNIPACSLCKHLTNKGDFYIKYPYE